MLNPRRGGLVAAHRRLVGQLKERNDVAVPGFEEDVHVRIVLAGRGYVILGKSSGVVHAEHPAVPLDGLLGVFAAIGGVMDSAEGNGVCVHCAVSSTLSAPRRT